MDNKRGACLVCGKPLQYFETERELTCALCGKTFSSSASCMDGHYVCDECHARQGVEVILEHCKKSASRDPVALAREIMADPYIYMHGNEHHILVGAVLLTAYRNAGGDIDLDAALEEMRARGSKYPGGSCGFWGCCGAAVSAGMFWSIATGTTPLSGKSWGLGNRLTAAALDAIGEIGGPRCCKRNSYTAIRTAAAFVKVIAHTCSMEESASPARSASTMRWVRVKVLPDPAPALTMSGRSSVLMTSSCPGVQRSRLIRRSPRRR